MVVEVALGISLALVILFIALPVVIWLVGRVLATVGGIFNGVTEKSRVSAPDER